MTTAPPPRPLEPEHLLWRVALGSLTLAAAVLLGSARFFPSADLPQHLGLIATLSDWSAQQAHYEWVPGQLQNVGYAVVGTVLSRVLGSPERGHGVLLGGMVIAWTFGLWVLARTLRRDERVALAAVPLFFGQVLVIGLLPYLLATALLPLVLAGAVRQGERPSALRFLGLSFAVFALFTLHLSVLVFLLPAVVGLVVARRTWRPAAWAWLWPLLPLGVHWLLTSEVLRPTQAGLTGTLAADFHTPLEVLRWLPRVLADVWTTRADEVFAFVALAAVGVACALGWRSETARPERRLVLGWAALGLGLCFAMPYSVGWLFVLNQRYAMVAAALLLLLVPRCDSRRVAAAFAACFAAASLHLGVTASALAEFEEEAAPVFELIDRLPPGARVLSLAAEGDSTSAHAKFVPFHHAGAWARVRKGAIVEPSFVRLPQSAIRYRASAEPPARPHDWEWDVLRFPDAADEAYFDFLLVRELGQARRFGPPWAPVGSAGAWSLYRRTP